MTKKEVEQYEDLLDVTQATESDLKRVKRVKERRRLPEQEADKTTASSEGNVSAFSGYGRTGVEGSGELQLQSRGVDLSDKGHAEYGVARAEDLSGHTTPRNGQDAPGVPGSYYAHHAEVKDRIRQFDQGENGATAVSKPMCPECRLWHQRTAERQKQVLTVIDEIYIRRFNSDGSVDVFYGHYGGWPDSQIGTLATHIEPGVPPSRRAYSEASPW